ncbi:hypothetical protein EVAR_62637_1 [Eumeta japonica]|uniref:Uncharacterized protein n=1 Tax=Eumeta variegata TaxID=151549 RepID=A0A4C2AGW0_EUMVA|nr:hypothetical protein EVAR_62637_1 [Eumeta japonica]
MKKAPGIELLANQESGFPVKSSRHFYDVVLQGFILICECVYVSTLAASRRLSPSISVEPQYPNFFAILGPLMTVARASSAVDIITMSTAELDHWIGKSSVVSQCLELTTCRFLKSSSSSSSSSLNLQPVAMTERDKSRYTEGSIRYLSELPMRPSTLVDLTHDSYQKIWNELGPQYRRSHREITLHKTLDHGAKQNLVSF